MAYSRLMSTDTIVTEATPELAEWAPFPGGELEGARPRALCAACRDALRAAARSSPLPRRGGPSLARSRKAVLCFQCYRAGLDRTRALRAAGALDTATEERFQSLLPFEPVNRPRLEMLKVERLHARAQSRAGHGQFAERRRRAQIAARHAIQRIAAGLREHRVAREDAARVMTAAAHAAEMQLPESWLPFVMAR
jgi:hypothetical protein